jgi:hypothetical protein
MEYHSFVREKMNIIFQFWLTLIKVFKDLVKLSSHIFTNTWISRMTKLVSTTTCLTLMISIYWRRLYIRMYLMRRQRFLLWFCLLFNHLCKLEIWILNFLPFINRNFLKYSFYQMLIFISRRFPVIFICIILCLRLRFFLFFFLRRFMRFTVLLVCWNDLYLLSCQTISCAEHPVKHCFIGTLGVIWVSQELRAFSLRINIDEVGIPFNLIFTL